MVYENLLTQAETESVKVSEKDMPSTVKGLYCNKTVWLNSRIQTNAEKSCTLAEELGHHHTSAGNILDQKKLSNRKQEQRAMWWAYEKLVPLEGIISAHKSGVGNRNELAEYLGITEDFLESALNRYQEKYGLYATVDNYSIRFDSLGVLEMFNGGE